MPAFLLIWNLSEACVLRVCEQFYMDVWKIKWKSGWSDGVVDGWTLFIAAEILLMKTLGLPHPEIETKVFQNFLTGTSAVNWQMKLKCYIPQRQIWDFRHQTNHLPTRQGKLSVSATIIKVTLNWLVFYRQNIIWKSFEITSNYEKCC